MTIDHVTPLHEACLGDHVACARTLLQAGANVSAPGMRSLSHMGCLREAGKVLILLLLPS